LLRQLDTDKPSTLFRHSEKVETSNDWPSTAHPAQVLEFNSQLLVRDCRAHPRAPLKTQSKLADRFRQRPAASVFALAATAGIDYAWNSFENGLQD